MSNQVVIIGAVRGGTTATSGVVRSLGIPFPESNDQHENPALLREFLIHGREDMVHKYDAMYPVWGQKMLVMRDSEVFGARLWQMDNPLVICVWRDIMAIDEKGGAHPPVNKHWRSWKKLLFSQYELVQMLHGMGFDIPTMHLSYEKLCKNTETEVRRIKDFIEAGVGITIPEELVPEAVKYVRPGKYWPWENPIDPVKRHVTHNITTGSD